MVKSPFKPSFSAYPVLGDLLLCISRSSLSSCRFSTYPFLGYQFTSVVLTRVVLMRSLKDEFVVELIGIGIGEQAGLRASLSSITSIHLKSLNYFIFNESKECQMKVNNLR